MVLVVVAAVWQVMVQMLQQQLAALVDLAVVAVEAVQQQAALAAQEYFTFSIRRKI